MPEPQVATIPQQLVVADIELEVIRRGRGHPLVLLHGLQNIDPRARFLDLLYQHCDIIAPSHQGQKPTTSAIQNVGGLIGLTAEQAMARGILFAGSPDTIYQQIMDFYNRVGGFGHLVMIGRSGFMTHAEAEKGLKLFAKEVLPPTQRDCSCAGRVTPDERSTQTISHRER